MTKIVTKTELREQYNVTEEDIANWRYILGECLMNLETHSEEFARYKKDRRKAQRALAKARKTVNALEVLMGREFLYADELEEICEPGYGVYPGLTPTLKDWQERALENIEHWSEVIEVSADNEEAHQILLEHRDICIENLKRVGEYNV